MTTRARPPVLCPSLVGRRDDCAVFHSLLTRAKSERGATALVSGEAGIGKSRLIQEVIRDAVTSGFQVLQGQCFPTDHSSPYAPVRDLLRPLLANPVLPPDDGGSATAPLRLVFPDLFALGGSTALPASDAESNKRRLFEAIVHVLTRSAASNPVLCILEDLHWCDDASLDVLHFLARRILASPFLLLLSYRNDEVRPALRHFLAQLDRERLAQETALIPLTHAEVGAMLQMIPALSATLRLQLLDPLYALTEGNPYFIEEVLTSLSVAGELSDRSPPLLLNEIPLPRSLHDAVQGRVIALSAGARQILVLAAVAGRQFDFDLLREVAHIDERALMSALKELIAAHLVVEESADQFVFRHALTRQVVASELLGRERALVHRQIAETMERLYAPSLTSHVADLAYHFAAAGVWEQTLHYAWVAGQRAQQVHAPRAALEHLTQALQAAEHLAIVPPAAVFQIRGQVYELLGDFASARADYETALESTRTSADRQAEWRVLTALGSLWVSRDYTEAGTWFRQAFERAASLGDPACQAHSFNRWGNWLVNTGRIEEGLHAHQEALRIFEEQHTTQGMAETLDLLGMAYGMGGDRVKAVEALRQAIALFRTLGDTQSLSSSLAMRALQSMPGSSETAYCPLSGRDACVQDALEALHLARQIGSLAGQAFAENALAHTLLSFGEFGPALSHAREAQRIASEIEHQQWIVATSYALGHIYVLLLVPALANIVIVLLR